MIQAWWNIDEGPVPPPELMNLFDKPEFAEVQAQLMAELAMGIIRAQDRLSIGPQNTKHQTNWPKQHDWYARYRHGGPTPYPYIS